MFRGFFNRIKKRKYYAGDYGKSLARYRRTHPESLTQEREQTYQWVRLIEKKRREQIQVEQNARPLSDELERAWTLYRMWETARDAFMSHPAATRSDFLRCWPSIRAELLKQHALEKLAGNSAGANRLMEELSEADEIFGIEEPRFSSVQH